MSGKNPLSDTMCRAAKSGTRSVSIDSLDSFEPTRPDADVAAAVRELLTAELASLRDEVRQNEDAAKKESKKTLLVGIVSIFLMILTLAATIVMPLLAE